MSTHGLDLGTLDLASRQVHEDGYTLSVLGSGASFGASQAAVREIVSMLADGNLVSYDRAGNREATFDVLIEGADGVALQAGEVALRRELYRPNMVTWTPPADFSAPTVFVVVTSEMAPLFDDVDELRTRRKFRVTLTCAPFARSAVPVTVEALAPPPVTPTTVTIANADTTTGWSTTAYTYTYATGTAATSAPITDIGDGVSTSADCVTLNFSYTPAAPVALTGTPYLTLEMSGSTPDFINGYYAGGGSFSSAFLVRAIPNGRTQYVFSVDPARSLSSLLIGWNKGGVTTNSEGNWVYASPSRVTFNVFDVSRTDTASQVTKRQQTRVLEVGGTERTPASIHVQSTTGVDGHGGLTIVHTSPEDGSGYSPPLRRWRTGASTGPEYVNANTLSGAWEDINYVAGGFNAKVPTSALPEGGYVLMARLRSATATLNQGTLYWSTSTLIGSSVDQQGYTNGSIKVALGSTPLVLPIAALSLPSVRTRSGQVEISLQAISAGAQIQFDEAWLFRADDDCALTIVNNYQQHMWLDSPDVTSPVPRVWIGPDRTSQNHPGDALQAMGTHVLHPDGTAVFTASLSDDPATDATFYRRWPNNAAE